MRVGGEPRGGLGLVHIGSRCALALDRGNEGVFVVFEHVHPEALLKLLGLDAVVDLADDVVLDGVEKGDDDVLAAHLQLLLARFS